MIFITGASGFIGSNLVNKLAQRGYKVICFVRKTSNISAIDKPNVKIAYGDITDKDSISKAIGDTTIVIHLAAITSAISSDYELSRKVNVEGTKNLLEICKKKNIKRVIHVTSESTKRKIKGTYAKTKAEADKLIRNSGIPYTIIRPSIAYGQGSRGLFAKTLNYIEMLPLIPIIGSGKQKIKPIHVDDVTDSIISCINSEKTIKKEYDLTGADKLTFNQFIEQILEELEVKKKKVHIPFSLVFFGVKLLSLFTKNPPVTTDNLLGLKQEVNMSFEAAKRDFNYRPLTFKEGLKRTFYDYFSANNKKRIAVIGLGKMGLLHASIINQISKAELVAITDINSGLKKQMKSIGFNVPFFTSVDKMIKNIKLDGVFICTPPSLNLSLSKKFIEKNISVFVEKPLSNNLENAAKMLKSLKQKKVTTSCGYMVAYNPLFKRLKQLIESNKFGRIISFDSSCYISQVFKKKTPKSKWQYNPKKTGGGVLITMASHLIFLLQWYFGDCSSVKGTMKSIYTKIDDEVSAKLTFKNGIMGSLKTSWSIKGYEDNTIGIKINTPKAVIEATSKLITIIHKKSGNIREIHISSLPDDSKFELGGKGYYNQNLDFINSIEKNKNTITNWENSFKTQKIIDSIYKSIGTKREEKI